MADRLSNSLSDAITNLKQAILLTGSNKSALTSAINTLVSSMNDSSYAFIEFRFDGADSPFADSRYLGFVYKYYNTLWRAELMGAGTNDLIIGNSTTSTWTAK